MIIFVYDHADPITSTVQTILQAVNTVVADIPLADGSVEYQTTLLLPSGTCEDSDTWLIADVHIPLAKSLLQQNGRKLGFLRRLQPLPYDASGFDTLFVFSRFGKDMFSRLYPELAGKLCLCRIPIEPSHFQIYRRQKRQTRELVFIQPFTPESLHIVEIYFGEILVHEGFVVTHLFAKTQQELALGEAELSLLQEGNNRGIKFVFSHNLEQYYTRMAQAGQLITFEWTNCVSNLLAAVALGITVVAPDYGPYPEFFSQDNLFPPFNLDSALAKVCNPRKNKPAWEEHLPGLVSPEYLELAESLRCFI